MTPVQPDKPLPLLGQLIPKALLHLEELGYSEGTRQHYALAWRTLLDFAREVESSPKLTQQLATKFLKSRGIPTQLAQGRPLSSTQRTVRSGLRILLELQATGKFRRQPKRAPEPSLPSSGVPPTSVTGQAFIGPQGCAGSDRSTTNSPPSTR